MGKQRGIYLLLMSVVLSLLVVAVACGGDEDTATPRATSKSPTATSPAPTPTAPGVVLPTATSPAPTATSPSPVIPTATSPSPVIPTATTAAVPTATTPPPRPEGTINVGYTAIGEGNFSPWTNGSPVSQLLPGLGLTETLWVLDPDGSYGGRLLEDWSISADGLTWTLNLRKGVQWHKGYGEWTVDDLLWNIDEGIREGSISAGAASHHRLFRNPDGGSTVVDAYTLEVNTGGLRTDFQAGLILHVSEFESFYSKAVFDQMTEAQAIRIGVGTGPWEFDEFKDEELIRLTAVEGHYVKTPAFAELVAWHMPAEETRIANFLTGNLDTMSMNIQNKPRLEEDPNVRFLIFPSKNSKFFMYGNYYPLTGEEPRPGWVRHLEDPTDMPYVSTDPDMNSAEWERARKIREAMAISIDRQSIADDLFAGEARPSYVDGFEGGGLPLARMSDPNIPNGIDLSQLKWDFDPDRARQLLVDGGYPDGFQTSFCLCAGGVDAPQNVMASAIGSMWEEIGIETLLEIFPYSAIGGDQFARNTRHRHLPAGGGGTTFEPLRGWTLTFDKGAFWNGGMEHDFIQAAMDEALVTVDAGERWEMQRVMAKWLFDNVFIIPVVLLNEVYPVGPKIEIWPVRGNQLNSYEEMLPRQ